MPRPAAGAGEVSPRPRRHSPRVGLFPSTCRDGADRPLTRTRFAVKPELGAPGKTTRSRAAVIKCL